MPVHGGSWKYCSFLSALFALGNSGVLFLLSRPEIWQSLFVRLGVACGLQSLDFLEILVLLVRNAWFDSGYLICGSLGGFGRNTHIFYVDVDLDCSVFSPFSCRVEKYAQSMLRFESLHVLFALGVRKIFSTSRCAGTCVMMRGIFHAQCAFFGPPR